MTVYLITACTEINAYSEHTVNIETVLQRIILNQPELASVRCFSIGEIGVTNLQVLLLPLEHALFITQSFLSNSNMSGNHFVPGNDNSPSSSMAQQPGVGLGLLYNMPPSLSIPCSVSPFVYSHLSQVCGHVFQPSHLSCCIQLSVQHLFQNCSVLHSFYMTKPLYSLAFYKPDNVLLLN